jgi:hypothetical protein
VHLPGGVGHATLFFEIGCNSLKFVRNDRRACERRDDVDRVFNNLDRFDGGDRIVRAFKMIDQLLPDFGGRLRRGGDADFVRGLRLAKSSA